MDKCDYEWKLRFMLDNSNTYKKLCKDPLQRLERELNAMLLELKRGGSIPDQLYYRLHLSAGKTVFVMYRNSTRSKVKC